MRVAKLLAKGMQYCSLYTLHLTTAERNYQKLMQQEVDHLRVRNSNLEVIEYINSLNTWDGMDSDFLMPFP